MAPTSAAQRFTDFVEDANALTEAAEAVRDASMTLMPETEGAGLFVATARKANPVAALCYGPGAQRSALLPGWFGDFPLSAEEVRTALPRAEEALLLSSAVRTRRAGSRTHPDHPGRRAPARPAAGLTRGRPPRPDPAGPLSLPVR